LFSCGKQQIQENWYLIGSDIQLYLNLKKDKVIRLFDGKDLIFEASVEDYKFVEKDRLKVDALMKKIGNKPEYKLKYPDYKDFIVWFEISPNKQQMKMIFNKFYKNPYYFAVKHDNMLDNPYRFLSNFEIEAFKNSSNFKDLKKDNNVEFLINKLPLLNEEEVAKEEKKPERKWLREKYNVGAITIRSMSDYLGDMDFSTYWATKDYWDTEFEIFIKDQFGKKLTQPIKIRGIYFNTGNLDQKANYFNYHRAKTIGIAFSKEYEGSLGISKANYNYLNYTATLPDNAEEKLIVFQNPVRANSIRLRFKDFYIGNKNAFALYDFAVFVDSD